MVPDPTIWPCKEMFWWHYYCSSRRWKNGTKDIKIRVIEVILDNGTKEYLATNLFDSTITQSMFQELYFYRWPVELKYKELKSRLAIEEFSGATTTSVFQEFYINILLSNEKRLKQMDEHTLTIKKFIFDGNKNYTN